MRQMNEGGSAVYKFVRTGLLVAGVIVIVVFTWLQASPAVAPWWLSVLGLLVAGILIWIDIRERRKKSERA